jgi:hypothetical protein
MVEVKYTRYESVSVNSVCCRIFGAIGISCTQINIPPVSRVLEQIASVPAGPCAS